MVTSTILFALLCALILLGAIVYSSGGHAGATAYLAAMALFSVAPETMKPTALVLNILVASIGVYRFRKADSIPWKTLMWLLIGSTPMAFLGGMIHLTSHIYLPLLGILLLMASVRLWIPDHVHEGRGDLKTPKPPWLVLTGMILGFLAGLTGIGGGIFLTPVLLLLVWETPRKTAGAAVTFILINSISGLLGHLSSLHHIPMEAGYLALMALIGGLVGTHLGAFRFNGKTIKRVNAVVLAFSGIKLLMEAYHYVAPMAHHL